MRNINSKWMLGATLAAALMAGCGGGGGSSPIASTDISQSVSALITYMNTLIAGNENGDLVDVNGITLATEEQAEPTMVQ